MTAPLPFAGADLGGTNFRLALVDLRGRVGARVNVPSPGNEGPEAVLAAVRSALKVVGGPVAGLGLAVAGPLDQGVLYDPPNLPGLRGVALGSFLSDALGFGVFLENDANAAAYGEFRCGAGQGARSLVLLTLGTGVGGGIILDGRILRGCHGLAGELGHTVAADHGPVCGCGGRGCLETFSSAPATVRRWREGVKEGRWKVPHGFRPEEVGGADLSDFAQRGDKGALAVFERTGHYLGRAVASFVNALDPDRVILTGGLTKAASFFLPALKKAFEGLALSPAREEVRIEIGSLGDNAGLIGAALLAAQTPKEGP
jgi:glucokinase